MGTHDKLMIGYVWILSMLGTFFLGAELMILKHDKEMRQAYQTRISDKTKLQMCQRLITENE